MGTYHPLAYAPGVQADVVSVRSATLLNPTVERTAVSTTLLIGDSRLGIFPVMLSYMRMG